MANGEDSEAKADGSVDGQPAFDLSLLAEEELESLCKTAGVDLSKVAALSSRTVAGARMDVREAFSTLQAEAEAEAAGAVVMPAELVEAVSDKAAAATFAAFFAGRVSADFHGGMPREVMEAAIVDNTTLAIVAYQLGAAHASAARAKDDSDVGSR